MINKVQGTSFTVTSSLGMAMEGRRALLLKLCSGRIHLRAGGQLLSPGQRFYPFRNHKGMEGQSGYQMFCNNSPGVGRKCACIYVVSKCHICLKPCLCHYQGSPLFSFLFSLFFTFYSFCHYSHYSGVLHIKHCPSAY